MQKRQRAVRARRRTKVGAALTTIGTLGLGLVGTLATTVASSIAAAPPAGATTFSTKTVSCFETPYVVPAGVTRLAVTVVGEAGEAGHNSIRGWGGAAGGQGSKVTGTMNVTPGQTLWVGVAAGTALPGGRGGTTWAQGTIGYGGRGGNASYIASSAPNGSNCILTPSQLRFVAAGGGGGGGGGGGTPISRYPTLMFGGAGGTENVHGHGDDGVGNDANDDHDGNGGTGATPTADGVGGAGATGGSAFLFDPRSGSPSPGSGSCVNGQGGADGSFQNGGWGGVAPAPGNFLNDKCMGFLGAQRAGGGGGGGGGYYSGGGGGGGDSGNGSGGGGGAGASFGGNIIEATNDEPSVTLRPIDTAPEITSASAAYFPVNGLTHFTATTTGFPAVHFGNTQGLPAWLTVTDQDNGTADVRGTPPPGTTGSFNVALRVFNSIGATATQNLTVIVTGPPTITSANSATFKAGVPNSFTVTTTGDPKPVITQNQTLPGWLSFTDNHDGTATLSGTPPVSNFATWTTTLSAVTQNNPPAATQSFTLEVLSSIAVANATPAMYTTQTRQATAIGTHPDGTTANVTSRVTWASATPAVATVSASGLITAVTQGTTNVTASLGLATGTMALTVKNPVSITITPANATYAPGATQQFTATGTYADGSTVNLSSVVTWYSPPSGGAAIQSMTPSGLATLTGTLATAGQLAASISTSPSATVIDQTSVQVGLGALSTVDVTPANATLSMSASTQLQMSSRGFYTSGAIGYLTNTTTWASSNPAVAGISAVGLVTGLTEGTTTISSTTAGVTGSTLLTVKAGTPTSIAVTPASSALSPGEVKQFKATATYANNSTGDITNQVTWQSTNPPAMTVTSTGQVRVVGSLAGDITTIVASVPGRSGSTSASITFDKPTAIAVTPAVKTVTAGRTVGYLAMGSFFNGAVADVTSYVDWGSTDFNIANASSSLISTNPNATGTVTIGATSKDHATVGTAQLTVTRVGLTGPQDGTAVPTQLFTSDPFNASNGPGGYTWTASNLPAGLSLSSTTGSSVTITGTVAAGAYASNTVKRVTVTAANATGSPASTSVFIDIVIPRSPQTITFVTPVHGTPGTTTQITATSTGGSTNSLAFGVAGVSVGICSVTGGTTLLSAGPPTWTYRINLNYLTSGTCVVTVTQGGDANYLAATNVTQSIPVNKGDLTVEADDESMTYGDASVPTTFGATVTGFQGTDTIASIGGTLTCTPSITPSATTHAGAYPITCSGLSTVDYALVYEPGTLSVEKAPLAVEPPVRTIGLNDPMPTFPPTYTGFVNGQGAADVDTAPTCTPSVSVSTAAGIFPVQCTGGADADYRFDYGVSLFTVEMVQVVATFAGTQAYGGTASFVVNPDAALPPGQTMTGTLTCTALNDATPLAATLPAGSYGVDPATCSGMAMSDPLNYRLVLSHGYVNVSASYPTLTWATPANITYGTPLGSGQLNATATGVDGQPLAGTFNYGSLPGTVFPVLTGANLTAYFTPADTTNYLPAAIAVSLDVDPAVLVTTPNAVSIVYGETLTITKTITGFVNGDGPGVLNSQPNCTASPTGIGQFPITCTGGTAMDYTFDNSATARVTVGQAPSAINVFEQVPGAPISIGTPTAFNAFVDVAYPGRGSANSGAVTFFDNGSPATCQFGSGGFGGGFANCMIAFSSNGRHLITAAYSGSPEVGPSSTSAPLVVTVGPVVPAFGVSGKVTDLAGTGLGNIQVAALNWFFGGVIASTTTAPDGSYALSLPTNFKMVKVRFTDSTSQYLRRFNGNRETFAAAPVITVAAGTPVDVKLPAGVDAVVGTVTDTGGVPLPNVTVRVNNASFGTTVALTTTDAAGRYRIPPVFPTSYRVIFNELASTAIHHAVSIPASVQAGVTTTVNATMGVGSKLTGIVRASGGPSVGPVGNITVIALTATWPALIAASTVSAADGSYTLPALAPGTFKIGFFDPRNNAKTRYGLASAYFGGPKILAVGLFPAYVAATPVTMTNADAVLPDMGLDPQVAVTPGTSLTTPFGTPVNLSATFLGQNLTGTATVMFDNVPHTVAVVNGQVLYVTDPTMTVGTHDGRISYDGDPKNIAQMSDKITLVVT